MQLEPDLAQWGETEGLTGCNRDQIAPQRNEGKCNQEPSEKTTENSHYAPQNTDSTAPAGRRGQACDTL